MNRLPVILAVLLTWCGPGVSHAATDDGLIIQSVLSEAETADLVFMREEEKLARDTYITLFETWGLRVFSNISSSEQTHMNTMLLMLNIYGVPDPVMDDRVGAFTNTALADMYEEFVEAGKVSLLDALYVGALIEEVDIRDIQVAIETSSHLDVITAYESLMAGSENHLRAFVSQIENLGVAYVAQVLDQSEVDAILGRTTPGVFEINAGLNDAWYFPETSGQGFFINVYPDLGQVSLAWFTYETERPADDAEANLGDAGHRWLTAVGPYSGDDAELQVFVTSGGVFDSEEPKPVSVTDGTIQLHFDSCNSGTVSYQISSIGRTGVVPIERVALDNVALCEALTGSAN